MIGQAPIHADKLRDQRQNDMTVIIFLYVDGVGRMMISGTCCDSKDWRRTKIVVGHLLIYHCFLCCTEYKYSETIYHKDKTKCDIKRTEGGSTKRVVIGIADLSLFSLL